MFHHHPCLHGSTDTYITGVNVLLLQQVTEAAADTPAGCVKMIDWFSRQKYTQDSYATERDLELDKVRAELAKPLINGIKF